MLEININHRGQKDLTFKVSHKADASSEQNSN